MDKLQLSNIQHIQKAQRNKRLALFVGAGVSMNSGVPSWNELINELKTELPQSVQDEKDDLKVAQLYKDSRGNIEYLNAIKRILKHRSVFPNIIHKALLALNPTHLITTNYDDLLEQAIDTEFKQYSVIRKDSDIPSVGYLNTLVKMHGDYDCNNIVLSENDYYDYARNFPLIRSYVLSLFASKVIVFVGFSFTDLNLRMILRELQSVLTDDMQRAYLISLDMPDEITVEYFRNKGINIIYLSKEEIESLKKCCKNQKSNPDGYEELSIKGKQLFDILNILKNFSPVFMEEPVKVLYDVLATYQEDIRVFGDGIRHIIPPHLSKYWSTHSSGVQTFSKYIQILEKKLSSVKGKKDFLESNPWLANRKTRIQLKKYAFLNYVFSIDSIQIVDETFLRHINEHLRRDSIDYYLDFDAKSINLKLMEFKVRNLHGTIDDLEYPFLLCKIGDYFKAYEEYNKVLSFAWSNHRYILYFIALYNRWSIRYLLRTQFWFNVPKEIEKIVSELDEINIQEVLNQLPLDQDIRAFLNDVISNKAISNSIIQLDDLNTKLHKQRISATKGGWSYNSHINALIAHYERVFQFNNWNYIYMDRNSYFQNVCNTTIHGVLNSYMTKGNERQTKLITFDQSLVQLLIFNSGDNSKLCEILNTYDVKKIELDDDAKKWLISAIENLGSNLSSRYWNDDIKANLLTIIAIGGVSDIDTEKLFKVFTSLIKDSHTLTRYRRVAISVIKNYKPDKDQAKDLLDLILNNNTSTNSYFEAVNALVNFLHKKDAKYDYERLNLKHPDDSLGLLYPIIKETDRDKLIEYYSRNFSYLEWYLVFVTENDVPIIDADLFNDKLDKYVTQFEGNRAGVCHHLLIMRNNPKYENIYQIIDDYEKKSVCMKFLHSPMDYESPEEPPIEWILECSDEEIEHLIKCQRYRNLIKRYVAEHNLTTSGKRLLNLL